VDPLDHLESWDNLEWLVNLAHLDFKDPPESLEEQDQRDPRDIAV